LAIVALIGLPLGPAAALAQPAITPYQIGLVFLDADLDIPYFPQVGMVNNEIVTDSVYRPFTLTAPTSLSVTQGGLAGWSEADARAAIRYRVEKFYRDIIPADPAHTISVNVYNGAAPPAAAGRRLNIVIGTNDVVLQNYGLSYVGAAFDSGQFPNDSYVAAIFANNLDGIGQGQGVTLATSELALNNFAGTIAHEIGHLFGLDHVPAGGSAPYPLMATGATGLSAAQKIAARSFEPASAAYLAATLPTTNRADFNMDGDVDVFQIDGRGDAQILASRLGAHPWASLAEGDANSDGDVDVFQIDGKGDAQLLASRIGQLSLPSGAPALRAMFAAADGLVPEPASLSLAASALALLEAARRRRSPRPPRRST
jgi:hypothetical protein